MPTFKQMIQNLTEKFIVTQKPPSPQQQAMEKTAEAAKKESERIQKEKGR